MITLKLSNTCKIKIHRRNSYKFPPSVYASADQKFNLHVTIRLINN